MMLLLVLGLTLFIAVHLVPSATELRNGLVTRFGARPYKLAFALVSLAGLVLIAVGYGKLQAMPGKNPALWYPPPWTRHAALALMLPAMILLVAAYVPSRIRTTVGHPMLAAIMVWALAHLLANGDLASVLLFGSFLTWALYDCFSVTSRQARGPLGSAEPGSWLNDVAVLAAGGLAYAGMLLWGHRLLIGVPLLAN